MQLKKISDNMSPSLDRIKNDLKSVPRDAFNYWQQTTPKRTGNARSKTTLAGNTINASYAYAQVLDKGRSKQAPRGMSGPTTQFITQLIRRILRK